jgi:hypothetical protein
VAETERLDRFRKSVVQVTCTTKQRPPGKKWGKIDQSIPYSSMAVSARWLYYLIVTEDSF